MKKRLAHCATAVLICLALLPLLAACGVEYDEAEVKKAASELIEASYEINGIYFGDGLPYDKEGSEISYYYSVSEESPYKTEAELREATLKVYTEDYSAFLFDKAFKGYSYDEEDISDGELSSPSIVFPRYLTDGDSFLVRKPGEEEKLTLNRTYDTESITVTDTSRGEVTVSVPSFKDGVPDVEIELVLKETESGWRLDTPTY